MPELSPVDIQPTLQNVYRSASPKINPGQYSFYSDLILSDQIPAWEVEMLLESNPDFEAFYERRLIGREWLREAKEISDRLDAMPVPETPAWVVFGLYLSGLAALLVAGWILTGALR